MKFFMPRSKMKLKKFFPNITDRLDIDGTKLGFTHEEKTLRLEFQRPEVFNFQTECVLANYYKVCAWDDRNKDIKGLVIEAQLTTDLIDLLDNSEKCLVLQNAIKVILNMVPDDGKRNIKEISNKIWQDSNLLQPMEILGGHCIAEFILNNQQAIELIDQTIKKRTQLTLFD